jgi:hypothetical protein
MRPELVCAVEDGWEGIRRVSLAAAGEGQSVLVIIRDRLDPDVRAMITTPPSMRLLDVSRRWFRLRLLWEVARAALRVRWIVVTKPRTKRWLAPVAAVCRSQVFELAETAAGYQVRGRAASPAPVWLQDTTWSG